LTRARLVVVASAKGSPGCSFVALGLAGRLAEARLETLLIDADAEDGSLGASLDLARSTAPSPLAGLGPITDAAIAGAAVAAGPGLACLDLSGPDHALDGRRLAEVARGHYSAIVADVGHSPGRLQRELVAAARRDIEAETRRSLERIRKEVADLTVVATEKLTRKTLTGEDHQRLVEEALAEVDFTALAGTNGEKG